MLKLWLIFLGGIAINTQYATVLADKKHSKDALNVIHEWKYLDYEFESKEARQKAIDSGIFDYTKSAPIDVDHWRDLTFVTVIRDEGVPSSLNIVSKKKGESGPLLAPYPDWTWATIDNCDSIISVYRVAIDKCDRLWVLDNGQIGSATACPPKLLVFDLLTSKLIKKVVIPNNVATNSTTGGGLLVTPIVQTFGHQCETTYVYIADVNGYGLITYDGKKFHRLTSSSLVPDPNALVYTIEGQSFKLEDGPVGMALSSKTGKLYYSAMSSKNLGYIDTKRITKHQGKNVKFHVAEDILSTQSSAKAISETGILFFGLVKDTAIGCWNEHSALEKKNLDIAVANSETLQFTSGLKIKKHGHEEELLAMTNRFQKLATGTTNFNEVNFRILKGDVKNLIKHTRCIPKSHG